jgi:OOP family OmpA-OmpF porin
MKHRHRLAVLVAASLGLASLQAGAADNGIYLGGSLGQSGVEFDDQIDETSFEYDADTTGYKLIAGWRFVDWFAVEANYVDLGEGSDKVLGEKVEVDVSGWSLSAVGFLPIGPVDLFARVGAVNWSADLTAPGIDVHDSDDGTDLTYGGGVQFRVWSISLRAEYERFDVADADTVDMISLGVTYTFL